MDNEKIIKHFKNILTGSATEQDNKDFSQMLIQIAKEGYGERELNPVNEALETLDIFLDELDEFYGLAALQYGHEAYEALETLRSWYNEAYIEEGCEQPTLDWLPMNYFDEHYGRSYKCPYCGHERIGTAKYCDECGKLLKV